MHTQLKASLVLNGAIIVGITLLGSGPALHFLRRYADAWLAHPIWRADVECPMPSLPKMRVSDTKRRQDIHDWQELSALRQTVLIVAHLSSNPYEGVKCGR